MYGVTFNDITADDENNCDAMEKLGTIECDVQSKQLENGEYNPIYSHPKTFFITRFAKF
jgi:hypothetical protein